MNRCSGRILGSLLCFVSLAGTAVEEEQSVGKNVHLTVTDHLIFSNSKSPGDPNAQATNLFIHEDRPRLEYDNYAVGIHFTNQFTTNGPKDKNSPFVLEKAYGTAEWTNWDMKLGDSYQELGRGIALSLFENPAFGIDNSLQGAAVRFHPAGLDTSVFGGRINAVTNPVAINPVTNPLTTHNIYLAGASAKVDVASETHLGAHYLMTLSQPIGASNLDQHAVLG